MGEQGRGVGEQGRGVLSFLRSFSDSDLLRPTIGREPRLVTPVHHSELPSLKHVEEERDIYMSVSSAALVAGRWFGVKSG